MSRSRLFLLALALPIAACGGTSNPVIPQIRPVEGGWLSSGFGPREEHPVLGHVADRVHAGYDFAVAEGTPIRAAIAGEVVFAGWRGGYGKTVVLDHGGGLTTLYGHARELRASPGDRVGAGEIIAFVGSTGLSTGPHLHYELRRHDVPIDPGSFEPGVAPPLAQAAPAASAPRTPRERAAADLLAWDGQVREARPARTWE